MRPELAVLVVVLPILAGCAAPGGESSSPADSLAPTAFMVSSPSVAVESCHFQDCYEPTVAADATGRLFAADARSSAVGVSLDGGATWMQRPQPPAKSGTVQRDALLQVAPSGRLFYSALVTVSPLDVPIAPGVPLAIQVAWSDDAAETWGGNLEFSLVAETAVPDRQWLGFAPDGGIYLSHARTDSIWVTRSDDGGSTWNGWVKVVREVGYSGGGAGPPVVDSAGRVFIPQCGESVDPADTWGTNIFISEDRGATFNRHAVPVWCNIFPMLSVGPDDGILLATVAGGLRLATSVDHGSTFSEPAVWSETADASPWPIAGMAGRATVAWFSVDGDVELRLSRGEVEDVDNVTTVRVGSPDGTLPARFQARTDFASAAVMPDGRVALVWVDGNQVKAAVVSESL